MVLRHLSLDNFVHPWLSSIYLLSVSGTLPVCTKGSTSVTFLPPLEANGSIGAYNDTVLVAIDNTLSILHFHGIKAIISPQNAGVVNGPNGCDAYCTKYGNSDMFYSSIAAKRDYGNRLKAILTYHSPNFGKPWAQLNDVILAFDIQNEPMIDSTTKLKANDPRRLDFWPCWGDEEPVEGSPHQSCYGGDWRIAVLLRP
jgi:mannan endo-1,4-beta-mannosidase